MNGSDVFDRVEIVGDDGEVRKLDRSEFAAMPMPERIQLLLAGNVRFFKGDDPVPATMAMKALRVAT